MSCFGAAALLAGASSPAIAQRAEPGHSGEASAPASAPADSAADYTLRIGTRLIELAPEITVSTKTYNGQFPGPLLRFTDGKRVVVDAAVDRGGGCGSSLPAGLRGSTASCSRVGADRALPMGGGNSRLG